jgi:hypothetical protein
MSAEARPGPPQDSAAPASAGPARRLLLAAFAHAPFWIDPPYELARRHAMPLLRFRHPLRRLVGIARDGRPAAALVAGVTSALDVDDLARGFFATSPAEEPMGGVPGAALARRLAALATDHDLVLARTWTVFARGAAEAGLLALPDLPELRLRVGPYEAMLAAANRKTRQLVRRCDRHGYRFSVTWGTHRFAEFYRDHHVPFVRSRHGTSAVVHAPEVLRRRLRRGGIGWVDLHGEPLFAGMFEIVGDTFRELVAGTPGGRDDLPVQRATYVCHAAHMRLAGERGLRWLSMGAARPWLSDGVLVHKRAWGGELAARPADHRSLLVGWRRWTPAVAAFLAAHPLVIREPGGFAAVAVAAHGTEESPAFWRARAPGGLRRLHLVAEGEVTSVGLCDGSPRCTTAALRGEASSAELLRLVRAAETST